MLDKLKRIFNKADDSREFIEDQFAKVLLTVDSSSKVDELEKKAIIAGITIANTYATSYGVPILPDKIKEQIADCTIKLFSKANKDLQKQLKKKSKGYQERHK